MISLDEYIETVYPTKDDLLTQLPIEAEAAGLPAIHIADEIGRLLQILIRASRVKTILEIGALFGYSAIWMARALPEGGHIISLEAEPRHAAISRQNVQRAGLADKVEIREGDARQTLPALSGQTFDLIFIDADKIGYPDYLDWARTLAHPGTLIIADNVWRRGGVGEATDESNRAIAEFNRRVAGDPGLLSTIVPTVEKNDALMVAIVE